MDDDVNTFQQLLVELRKININNNISQPPKACSVQDTQKVNVNQMEENPQITPWNPANFGARTINVLPRSNGTNIIGSSFAKDYNKLSKSGTIDDKMQREEFISRYNIQGFSCVNAGERVNNLIKEVVFQNVDSVVSGIYWAKSIAGIKYEVVPNPRITYDETLHYYGGMKEAFISQFNGGTYNNIQVIEPAQFQKLNGKWILLKQGRIQLS